MRIRVRTAKKSVLVLKFISSNLKKKYVLKLKQIISKHAKSLTRIMKNNIFVLGKQLAEAPAREVDE